MSICLSPLGYLASQCTGDFESKSISLILAYRYPFFSHLKITFLMILLCFYSFLGLGSFQTILPCIVGELAAGGSGALPVGVSDRLQLTCGMCHVTNNFQWIGPRILLLWNALFRRCHRLINPLKSLLQLPKLFPDYWAKAEFFRKLLVEDSIWTHLIWSPL